jgi:transposase InsO family protein
MRFHGNAKTCPHSRRLLVERLERGWTVTEAAQAAGVSARTASKWRARWRSEGDAGLLDRSSAPKRVPHRTPADRVRVIELLRRLRMTAAEIAEVLGMALSTVSAILKRIGLGKRSRLEPLEPPNRYECSRPGELLHIDVKKLARFSRPGQRVLGRGRGRFETAAGYEYLHVCVDDYSRVAYAELLPDERADSAIAFLRRALAFFAARGVACERILTDNGSAYLARAFALACRAFGLRHTRTRPRRPRTNGKAERFIQTMLAEWAYERLYATSDERGRRDAALAQPLQLPATTRQPQPPTAWLAAEQRG